jgi:hypothetical protein
MNNERGQITIFIIVAIIIVLAILVFFLISSGGSSDRKSDQNIRKFIEDCTKNEGERSLVLLGLMGGDINQENSLDFEDYKISYLFFENENKLDSIENITSEFEGFFLENFDSCIDDFSEFENRGFEVDVHKISTEVILGESVEFNTDYSVTITKGDNSEFFENIFGHEVFVNFTKYYSVTNNILNMYQDLEGTVDIFYLLDQELNVTMTPTEDALLFILEDHDALVREGINYAFFFGIELGEDDEI